MADNNLNITRDAGRREDVGAQSEFTRAVDDNQRIGRSGLLPVRQRRLYMYDRDQGAAGASLKGSSDKADRLPIEEVSRLLNVIHVQFGVSHQMERFLYDFDHQMYLCYALNGGSQFTPSERVRFYVGAPNDDGVFENSFDFSTVHQILGVDFRRFFRTLANDVVLACKHVIEHCDFDDAEMVEQRRQLINLAQIRNISRYPHLVADCADAATNISSNELHAIMKSKMTVIGNTANSVDKRSSAFAVRSADNYDSSVGASVSRNHDVNISEYHD